MKILVLLFFFQIWAESQCQLAGNPRVRLLQGIVSGTWKQSHSGREFASFEGIPYARPPVGKYRFREPQRPKAWVGIWEATEPASKCLQFDPFIPNEGSEDCLYLNVYTPQSNGVASLPVIVYIHGGAFSYGAGSHYGPKFLLDKNVVYVTINYRLNVFGFLSTGDDVVPGNMGLKDQSFALHWIKSNIMMFGGDSNSITLIGLSAGAASVHYHFLSPLSRGTFNRGISFGGTALSPWASTRNPQARARALAAHVGCPTTTSREMVDCLRYRPANSLLSATKLFQSLKDDTILDFPNAVFKPVVETAASMGPFLNQIPYDVIRSGRAQQLPWIVAVTSEEGLYPGAFFSSDEALQNLESNWGSISSILFNYNESLPLAQHPMSASRIKQHYLQGKPVSRETYPHLIKALGDRNVFTGSEKSARLHATTSTQPVYFYRFSYRGPQSLSEAMTRTSDNYGVCHGDDTLYFTDTPLLDPTLTPETIAMTNFMVDLLYSFAVNGVPQVKSVQWEPVDQSRELKYLEINSPYHQKLMTSLDLSNNEFWRTFGFIENERLSTYIPRDEF